MKTLHVLRICSVLVIVLAAFAFASPVFAGGPVHTVDTFDWNGTWAAGDNPCGFDIAEHQYGNIRTNTWYDENGNPIRDIAIFGNLKETDSANGRSVNLQMQGPTHHTYSSNPDGTYTVTDQITGATILITVPGSGKIFGGAGYIHQTTTFDASGNVIGYTLIKQVGNQDFSDPAWAAYCKYLSGE